MPKLVKFKFNNVIGPLVRKHRDQRGWSQSDLAVRLQCAGWDIPRGAVAKVESRIQFVRDYQLICLAGALEIDVRELFPAPPSGEPTRDYVDRLLNG